MTQAKLGFADLNVDVPSHICLFYANDEELRARLGFLAHTLDNPTQVAVLFGKQKRLEEVLGYSHSRRRTHPVPWLHRLG